MWNSPIQRIGVSVLVLSVLGCHTTGVVAHQEQFIASTRPARVWVTGQDNSVVELSHPKVQSDTLTGFTLGGVYTEIPMSDVKLMRARVKSTGRTVLLVAASAVASGAVLGALIGSGGGQKYCLVPGTEVWLANMLLQPGQYVPC